MVQTYFWLAALFFGTAAVGYLWGLFEFLRLARAKRKPDSSPLIVSIFLPFFAPLIALRRLKKPRGVTIFALSGLSPILAFGFVYASYHSLTAQLGDSLQRALLMAPAESAAEFLEKKRVARCEVSDSYYVHNGTPFFELVCKPKIMGSSDFSAQKNRTIAQVRDKIAPEIANFLSKQKRRYGFYLKTEIVNGAYYCRKISSDGKVDGEGYVLQNEKLACHQEEPESA